MNAPLRPDELSPEQTLAPLFVGPGQSGWSESADLVSQKWMARSRARILAGLANSGQPALAGMLGQALRARFSAWRPEFAMAERAAAQGKLGLAALQYAVACEPGAAGLELTTACAEAACLYLDGWLLLVQGDCTLSLSSAELVLASAAGEQRYRLADRRWVPAQRVDLPGWAPETLPGHAPRVLIRAALPCSQGVFPWPGQRVMLGLAQGRGGNAVDPPGSAEIHAAVARLAQSAPAYRDWVASAIDTLVVLHGENSSSADYPGLVVLGSQPSALDACESLVMQAACQHFSRLASIIEPIQSGPEEIHYVPERRSYVTTRHLLAHAHEKANLVAMLRMLAPDCAAARRRLALRSMQFAVELESLLDQARSLTPAGGRFWSQLQQLAASERDHASLM